MKLTLEFLTAQPVSQDLAKTFWLNYSYFSTIHTQDYGEVYRLGADGPGGEADLATEINRLADEVRKLTSDAGNEITLVVRAAARR